ncbi:hypothetical protein CG717_13385 [Streptomyces sp. CB02613]|nr:hypothetical protein CG717_13385 [Streptomyces sp. CB02613]
MGIIHALLYFLLELLELLAPGSGRRRGGALPVAPVCVVRQTEAAVQPRALARRGTSGRTGLARELAARPRSPYGLVERLDGEATALVRPYLVEHERGEEHVDRRRLQRLSLVMVADFGIDLDTRDVHAMGAA